MDKLAMRTTSRTEQNFSILSGLFPNAVTESMDENGVVVRAIDADVLQQEINARVVSGKEERYQFTWPEKKKAVLLANAPLAATLRPCREESVDFDNTENLYIEGDNLDVLKLLRETYLNRVKMIYIDPPYNTGNDFIYEDDFAEDSGEFLARDQQYNDTGKRMVRNLDSNGRFHTDWLNMMYPRLRVARDLLTDDGIVFISIDDNEQTNLIKIMNEVFGESNFVATFAWEKRTNRENRKLVSSRHEHIACFAKNLQGKRILKQLPMTSKALANYTNPDNDPRGLWKSDPATAQAGHGTRTQFYVLEAPNGKRHELESGCCWRFSEEAMKKEIAEGRIWFGKDGNGVPRKKTYLNEKDRGLTPESIIFAEDVGTNEIAKNKIKELFNGIAVFETPKPVDLIKHQVLLTTDGSDIILDFFSGSATTAHAVMQLNAEDGGKRKFIMVQLPEVCGESSEAAKSGYANICEIGKERIRRAGAKIKADNADKEGITDLDIGFRVLKLDSSNMKDVYYTPQDMISPSGVFRIPIDGLLDNIKPDRNAEDLLFQVMLDLGLPLSSAIERREIDGKAVFSVADNCLTACFERTTDAIVAEIAQREPRYAVFRDSGFADDATLTNFEQIFTTYSPTTIRKVL